VLIMMFDGLKRRHHIEGIVRQRNPVATTDKKCEVWLVIQMFCVFDTRSVDVDTRYRLCGCRQQGRAVPFPGGNIQDGFAGNQLQAQGVAVQMLVLDLPFDRWNISFACKVHAGGSLPKFGMITAWMGRMNWSGR